MKKLPLVLAFILVLSLILSVGNPQSAAFANTVERPALVPNGFVG